VLVHYVPEIKHKKFNLLVLLSVQTDISTIWQKRLLHSGSGSLQSWSSSDSSATTTMARSGTALLPLVRPAIALLLLVSLGPRDVWACAPHNQQTTTPPSDQFKSVKFYICSKYMPTFISIAKIFFKTNFKTLFFWNTRSRGYRIFSV